ncbi:MAG: Gfo/Idh/MocA family oxidoreductase [Verrucomicrobiota bacterium]
MIKLVREPIRCVIIGIGGYGRNHLHDLYTLAEEGKVILVAATIKDDNELPEEQEHLKQLGCQLFQDPSKMLTTLKGQVDLCFINTSISSHYQFIREAIQADCHVFVEKPMVTVIQDALELRDLSRATGKWIAVGFQHMYEPNLHQLKQFLCDGGIGKIEKATGTGKWPRSLSYYNRNPWAGTVRHQDVWALDSPVSNALAHYIQLTLFLTGDQTSSVASPTSLCAETYRAMPIESFDTGFISIETLEGIDIFFAVTHACAQHHPPRVQIHGDRGMLDWVVSDYRKDGSCTVHLHSGEQIHFPLPKHEEYRKKLIPSIIEHARDPGNYVCSVDSVIPHILCINGIYESSQVSPFPEDIIERRIDDGEEFRFLSGIEKLVDRTAKQMQFPSELGVPWSSVGKRVHLGEYVHFPQRQTSPLIAASV